MMLLAEAERREARHDLWLAGSTAIVAGFVNVCSVIAFFAFASNVTGHFAIFAEEIVKGHWHQVSVVCAWLALFLGGALIANFLVTAVGFRRPYWGRLSPLVLELLILGAVGYYGQVHYSETLRETEYLVGALLLAMGLQNSMVASVSGGVVKTTHLTGLLTDLGMELSMFAQRRFRGDARLRFKLRLRFVVVGYYIAGGIAGGVFFQRWGFAAFYTASTILLLILAHELVVLTQRAAANSVPQDGELLLSPVVAETAAAPAGHGARATAAIRGHGSEA